MKINTSLVNIIISGVKLTFNRNIDPLGIRIDSILKIKPVTLMLFFETYERIWMIKRSMMHFKPFQANLQR
jgi:hypothetical protein